MDTLFFENIDGIFKGQYIHINDASVSCVNHMSGIICIN